MIVVVVVSMKIVKATNQIQFNLLLLLLFWYLKVVVDVVAMNIVFVLVK